MTMMATKPTLNATEYTECERGDYRDPDGGADALAGLHDATGTSRVLQWNFSQRERLVRTDH